MTTELATFGKSVSTLRRALIFKIETMLPLTGMVVTLVGFVGDGAPVKGLDGVYNLCGSSADVQQHYTIEKCGPDDGRA